MVAKLQAGKLMRACALLFASPQSWHESTSSSRYLGTGYLHDQDAQDGRATAVFATELRTGGTYDVRLAWPANNNRASTVRVTVTHADGVAVMSINQREKPAIDGLFQSLGEFRFEDRGEVSITNQGADGYVIVDGVQWLPSTSK